MWALDPLYDSLSIDDYDSGRMQTVGRTFHLDEYQKSAFLRGFVTFEGKSKGIAAWMIDGQVVPPKCPRYAYSLKTITIFSHRFDLQKFN